MLILNTGGTFNKRYNPLSGAMEVPFDNAAIDAIVSRFTCKFDIAGVLYKDSVEFTNEDRKMIADIILASHEKRIVIVHGTDTIHLTAAYLDALLEDRVVVLTGAMVPYEIDAVEATANFSMALGYADAQRCDGVYICMQGLCVPWDRIEKNRELGRFEIVQD